MSLIDDALKRAQAAQGNKPPEGGKRPWTPAPLPDPRPARRRRALRIAAAVVILVAAAGAGWLLLRPKRVEPALEAAAREAQAVETVPVPPSNVSVPPPKKNGSPPGPAASAAGAALRPTEAPRPAPSRPAVDFDAVPSVTVAAPSWATRAQRTPHAVLGLGPSASASPAVALPAQSAPQVAAPAERPVERPAAAAPSRTYVGTAALPGGGKLELGGIVYSETNATAIVNGKIVGVGAVLEGYEIRRIEESRVELVGPGGQTITLTLR